jgi:hypothetical protein
MLQPTHLRVRPGRGEAARLERFPVLARKLKKKNRQGLGCLASKLKLKQPCKTWPIGKRVEYILDKLETLVLPDVSVKLVGDLVVSEQGVYFVLCNGPGEDGLDRVSCDESSFKMFLQGSNEVAELSGAILGVSCECSVHRKEALFFPCQ